MIPAPEVKRMRARAYAAQLFRNYAGNIMIWRVRSF